MFGAGVDGIALFGTTGEGQSFSVAQRRSGLDALLAAGVPAKRIVVGTGCAALDDAIELTRHESRRAAPRLSPPEGCGARRRSGGALSSATTISAAPSPLARHARLRRVLRKTGFWASGVVIVSPALLVFLWMLSLSLKNEIDNLAYPPVFIPDPPTLRNYVQVFTENSMFLYFWNSIVVTGGATVLALLVGVPAGYGIARLNAHKLTVLILIARMTPALSFLIPLYTAFNFLGLNNTPYALIITHLVITVPIVVYIMDPIRGCR